MIDRLLALLRGIPSRLVQMRGYWGGVIMRAVDYLRR
jgi:hypothetical protein